MPAEGRVACSCETAKLRAQEVNLAGRQHRCGRSSIIFPRLPLPVPNAGASYAV